MTRGDTRAVSLTRNGARDLVRGLNIHVTRHGRGAGRDGAGNVVQDASGVGTALEADCGAGSKLLRLHG
jgi:hypothetical protein